MENFHGYSLPRGIMKSPPTSVRYATGGPELPPRFDGLEKSEKGLFRYFSVMGRSYSIEFAAF
jgi:hypothetical protein